jgi:hypothetical protein
MALLFAGQSQAGDIDAILPDNDNTSSFQVKDSMDNVLMKVQSGGNVGIGTVSPSASYKLTVDGGGSAYGIYVNNVGDTGIESNGYNYGLTASGRSRAVQGTSTDGYGIYGQSTNSFAGYFDGDGYISGKVGIGTVSPSASYKLTVDGGGSAYGIYVNNVGDTGIESNGYNYGLTASGRSRAVQGTSTDGYGIYGQSTNSFAGYFDGDGYISGDVGIGTTTPGYKLHVNGDAAGTSWTNLSSRDYKEEIQKVDEAVHPMMLTKLMNMDLTTYKYKREYGGDGDRRLGFIAEDMPEEVISKDGKGVDIYELLALTIGAMKAQQRENEILKAKLEEITSRLEALEK